MPSPDKRVLGLYRPGSVHTVGDGFHVRNLFPSNEVGERLSPFLLLDYAGPTLYAPTDEPRGVGEHPHRGFETVTLVYQGRVAHRDSAGNAGVIGPGDVQWMTAAAGVVHEEKHEREFARRGGTLQMVQLWVNLPRREKLGAPRYQEIHAEAIPVVASRGAKLRVIAGEHGGANGPARTSSPLELFDLRLEAGAEWSAALPRGHTAAVVVLSGKASVNGSRPLAEAEMALLDLEGDGVRVSAEVETIALLLGGQPLGEPVVAHGPFVMSTDQEIHQAIRDYQSGRMGHLG
ncbi:MAG: pirin family protein [Planctomycetes bacterium]|nr:pirin family protein [Planctomycetota bacterium]